MPPIAQGDILGNLWYAFFMDTLEITNILLGIVTLSILVVSFLVTWASIVVIRTLRNIEDISNNMRKGSAKLVGEVDGLLRFLHSLGMLFSRSTKKKKK